MEFLNGVFNWNFEGNFESRILHRDFYGDYVRVF